MLSFQYIHERCAFGVFFFIPICQYILVYIFIQCLGFYVKLPTNIFSVLNLLCIAIQKNGRIGSQIHFSPQQSCWSVRQTATNSITATPLPGLSLHCRLLLDQKFSVPRAIWSEYWFSVVLLGANDGEWCGALKMPMYMTIGKSPVFPDGMISTVNMTKMDNRDDDCAYDEDDGDNFL